MAADATGSAVLAIRRLNTPAMPAAAPTGPSATGNHIIRLAKLALSCSKKISAAVTSAPAAVSADRLRSKWPVSMSRTTRSMPWARPAPPPRRTAKLVRMLTVLLVLELADLVFEQRGGDGGLTRLAA